MIDKTLNPGCRVDKFEANPNYDINIFQHRSLQDRVQEQTNTLRKHGLHFLIRYSICYVWLLRRLEKLEKLNSTMLPSLDDS